MPRLINLAGQRFGKLTVIERNGTNNNGSATWLCHCDCGNTKTVSGRELVKGDTKSCGCARHNPRKHGMSNTRLYKIWIGIKGRCCNQSDRAYKNYGGRGIHLCKEWADSFDCFKEWALDNGYNDTLTIERVDNDKGYFPGNCTWKTQYEQTQNRRSCILVTIGDKTMNLQQWCDEFGTNYKLAHNRIRKLGWEPVKALTTPVDESKRSKRK